MKLFNIIHTCLVFAFVGIWLYIEIRYEPQSLYWLIGKLAGFSLVFASIIFIRIKQKKDRKWSLVFLSCWWILYFCYFGYREIKKYNEKVCQDKFGREFNGRRNALGIPGIPANWVMEYRWSSSVDWKGKDVMLGHKRKSVEIRDCIVEYEDDDYDLKSSDTVKRYMSIRSKYANGKGKDSIFYDYTIGDSTRAVSRKQADSIFAADGIRKDY